jgi:hypothetical protein
LRAFTSKEYEVPQERPVKAWERPVIQPESAPVVMLWTRYPVPAGFPFSSQEAVISPELVREAESEAGMAAAVYALIEDVFELFPTASVIFAESV